MKNCSLYKYFGAPFGGILAGDSERLKDMYHTRRMFGGGLASTYFVAALALKGIEGFEERFAKAISKARVLFEMLNELPGIEVGELEHGSNIFPVSFGPDLNADIIVQRLKEGDVFVHPSEGADFVSVLVVNTTVLRQPNDAIFTTFKEALSAAQS